MRRPTGTFAIVLLTVAISILVYYGLDPLEWSQRAGFIPARASGVGTDFAAVPVWLTPLTCTLMHGGMLHLVSNMLILAFVGRMTEPVVGGVGIVILYIAGAYGAAFAQWLPDPHSVTPMIGASGAASAILGAYALIFGRARARAIGPVPATVVHVLWLAAAWVVLNLMLAFAMQASGYGVAAAAHIGGFLAGIALARPLARRHLRRLA